MEKGQEEDDDDDGEVKDVITCNRNYVNLKTTKDV